MSETKTRTLIYIDGLAKTVTRRIGGQDETRSITSFDPIVWDRLAAEGLAHLWKNGVSFADIQSGQAIPDRSIPKTRGASTRVSEDSKWREAIAHAVAEYETKAGFVGVSKEAKDAALAEGRAHAASLDRADVKDLKGRFTVQLWFGKLFADKTPVQRPKLQEAAD